MRVRTSGQLVSPLGNSVSPIDTAAEQAHTPRRASAELQTLAEPGTVDHGDSPTSSPHGPFVRFSSSASLKAGPEADEKSVGGRSRRIFMIDAPWLRECLGPRPRPAGGLGVPRSRA